MNFLSKVRGYRSKRANFPSKFRDSLASTVNYGSKVRGNKTIGALKVHGKVAEISFEAKFLRKAMKSQEIH